jgi:hypothetical protein
VDAKSSKPGLKVVSRRRFMEIVAVGTGGMVLSVGAVMLTEFPGSRSIVADSLPVQNPAFLHIPGTNPGHIILYCFKPDREPLAYDLNPGALAIWQLCASSEKERPGYPTVEQIAKELADKFDENTVKEFLGELQSRGLIYFFNENSRVYFDYVAEG